MGVSPYAYYAWAKRPGQLISEDTLHLHGRVKKLFSDSRQSLGSRELMKILREEDYQVGR
jgi:putative transposase